MEKANKLTMYFVRAIFRKLMHGTTSGFHQNEIKIFNL